MRHPLVPALLVVLALVGYALVGAALAHAAPAGATPLDAAPPDAAPRAAGTAADATVAGQVTGADGDPVADAYVLLEPAPADVLREATDGDRDVRESLLRVAQTDPDGVVVARTDGAGRYSAAVAPGTYRVVAVTADAGAVTPLRRVEADGDATADLTVDADRVLELDAPGDGPVEPGEEATVSVAVHNDDDEAVRNLSVTLAELPADLELLGVETDGAYDADARRVSWSSVPPDEAATLTLRLAVPRDAEHGYHDLELSAASDSHFVETLDRARVTVRPADATPTPTALPGGDAGTDTPTPTADIGDLHTPVTPTLTPTHHVDGYSREGVLRVAVGAVLALLAALALLAGVVVRRAG